MKTHTKIAWILAGTVAGVCFAATFIQSPTMNPFTILGQLVGSAGLGIVIFFITYGLGSLIVRVKRSGK